MAKFTTSSLRQSFDRRTFVIGAIQGGVGLLLAARMGYIAVAENEKYSMESESNRVNLSLIPPRRGWILDRNGAPLDGRQLTQAVALQDRIGLVDLQLSAARYSSTTAGLWQQRITLLQQLGLLHLQPYLVATQRAASNDHLISM